MKITLLSVESNSVVSFRCVAGDARALWRSTKLAPVAGQQYEVEIDIITVLSSGAIATAAPNGNCLERIGSKTRATTTVEGVDEDGMAYLRLAPDCLLMAEFAGVVVEPDMIASFTLEPAELHVWVTGC